MELVYLWVEEYKNIHRQGFNFSPRFHCDFKAEYEIDEQSNEVLKDNCELIICDKKDPNCKEREECKSFCNEPYMENFFGENINVTAIVGKNGSGKSILLEYLSYRGIGEFEGEKSKQYIFIIKKDNKIVIDSTLKFSLKSTSLLDCEEKPITKELTVILKNFHQIPRNYVTAGKHNVKNISNEIYYKKIIEKSEYKNKFYDTFSIYESLTLLNFFRIKNIVLPPDIVLPKEIAIHIQNPKKINSNFTFTNNIGTDMRNILTPHIDKKAIEDFLNELSNLNAQTTPAGYDIKELYKKDLSKLIYSLKEIYKKESKLKEVILLHLDKKLSSGTLELLRMFANLYQALNTIEKNDILIFLDEPDSFLHPNWHKQLLNILIIFFQVNYNKNYNFHLILTTHSPFLLSDIPKQNIIFLDTDENGNCKVVDGLKEKKETFGANIHTLLSDSFFMEDGLMGEFAREKIDKAFELLNKQEFTKEDEKYCELIISIVGEPIIKSQMQKMLDSKRLKKVDKIEELEKHIADLQKQVDEMKNNA